MNLKADSQWRSPPAEQGFLEEQAGNSQQAVPMASKQHKWYQAMRVVHERGRRSQKRFHHCHVGAQCWLTNGSFPTCPPGKPLTVLVESPPRCSFAAVGWGATRRRSSLPRFAVRRVSVRKNPAFECGGIPDRRLVPESGARCSRWGRLTQEFPERRSESYSSSSPPGPMFFIRHRK